MKIIDEYVEYIKNMRGFVKRHCQMHHRTCNLWNEFLNLNWNKDIFSAMPSDLLYYIKHRQNTGRVQNVTITKELCMLRTFYAYLQDFGKIESNPAASLPELICNPPAEKKYLTVDECFTILESIDTSTAIGLRDHTIIGLFWATGLRCNELRCLEPRDIDLREGCLIVRKGKGGKQRQVYFNSVMLESLTRYWIMMEGEADTPLFHTLANANKKKLSRYRLSEIVRQKGLQAGISKKTGHLMFRHTFATHMYEAGVCMKDIKEMLGHDDETETTIYVHISIETTRKFLEEHIANPSKYRKGDRR